MWASLLPAFFAKTITGAFDGSGLSFAERVTSPFVLAALVGVGFCIGAQGALLAVPSGIWTAVAAVTTAAEIYLTAFASFDDSGVVALLLAPLLLIAGALSLVPAAIGAVKALPPV